jgi:hypothetical protein
MTESVQAREEQESKRRKEIKMSLTLATYVWPIPESNEDLLQKHWRNKPRSIAGARRAI